MAEEQQHPILVVEDDRDIREALVSVLADEGYSAVAADNGQRGLEEVEKRLPGLVLLDLMMPVMGGAEFLARLREQHDAAAVPVVILSAWPREVKALTGAQGFVPKPVDLSKLLDTVQRFCGPGARP